MTVKMALEIIQSTMLERGEDLSAFFLQDALCVKLDTYRVQLSEGYQHSLMSGIIDLARVISDGQRDELELS